MTTDPTTTTYAEHVARLIRHDLRAFDPDKLPRSWRDLGDYFDVNGYFLTADADLGLDFDLARYQEAEDTVAASLGWPSPSASLGAFYVDELQAVEPHELTSVEGIVVEIAAEPDWMGLPRVTVWGPTRDAVIEYVRREWGEEDPQWFADHVVARIVEVTR